MALGSVPGRNAPPTQRYALEGLHCAGCARALEQVLRREPGLEAVQLSFATASIFLPPDRVERAREVVARVLPGVRIVPSEPQHASREGTEGLGDAGPGGAPATDPPARARRLVELGLAAAVLVGATVLHLRTPSPHLALAADAVLLAVYLWVGRGVLRAAVRNARRGQLFDENFLMALATAGAVALHALPEAVGVMLLYTVGEFFQDLAVQRSRSSIRALMDLRPDSASVVRGGRILRVPPESVAVGETVLVRPGERVPLDGRVAAGSSFVDTSPLTGEPVPRRVGPGDEVRAGTVNLHGLLRVRVLRPFGESSVARTLRLVETAAARKAPPEKFITAFSRRYTPAVVAAAASLALLPPLVVPGAEPSEWVRRALVLLVVACPCALVLSVPLSYFAGLGSAARRGVLVKGANFLDALVRLDTVVWDKTGTLTRGVFQVLDVVPSEGFSRDRVLELAAHAEAFSSHPVARSVVQAYGRPVDRARVSDHQEIPGSGVRACVDGQRVVVGNDRLLHREGVPHETCEAEGTVVYVAADGVLAGCLVIGDDMKPQAPAAVRALRALGVRRQVLLTGDGRRVAERVGRALELDQVYAELLPEDKVAVVERLDAERRCARPPGALAVVGDGINDAPVLARAEIGVAMGGLGSDAAIEAADVVIMDDNPMKLAAVVSVARATRRVVIQNIALALGVKLAFVVLGASGAASLWEAVFADVGVSLLAVLNATRVLRARP